MVRASVPGARLAIVAMLGLSLMIAGCVAPDGAPGAQTDDQEPFKLAFSVKDDFSAFVADAQPLADAIEETTDRPTEILAVEDESAAIAAVASGDATAAFLDGGAAWIGWQTFGLEAIAADAKGDGRTHYVATAWVMDDSDIETVADLEGQTSCHTGELKSAGMLMPMGYLIKNGYIDVSDLPDDVSAIKTAREAFFQDPIVGGGYQGAFQCLSEGHGDVAFVKDSTWQDHCGDEAETWCHDREDYRVLETFAQVPSHPVMVAEDLPVQERALLKYALLALNDDQEGQAVLSEVLGTPAIEHVETEAHLGGYGELVSQLPGIEDHLAGKTLV